MPAYYNEIDPFAADWLENLIEAGHIAPGVVDRRSIVDVRPDDLRGFAQCHFFAGLGGWSFALRLAGLPDNSPVWTGSCPCQPFSAAGKRGGTADERHLWPAFFHLIEQCGPATVLGEQVASRDGLDWLDLVFADLEGAGYDVGAADLCAAGVGAPHIRQRSFFVADASDGGHVGRGRSLASDGRTASRLEPERLYDARLVGDTDDTGLEGRRVPDGQRACERPLGPTGGWRDVDWLPCRDGKTRPVEPGTFPLAHGIPGRVGRLRAYGNAIVPQVAATFIQAAIPFRLGVFA